VVHHTVARARSAPTDRSMPPPIITNVIPIVTTPIADARLSTVSSLAQNLAGSRKMSGRVIAPMTSSARRTPASASVRLTGSTATRPPFPMLSVRSTVVLMPAPRSARTGHEARSTEPADSLADAHSCQTPFQQRPRHDEVEHAAFVEFLGGRLLDQPALAHDQHPVGQAQHLGHLAGHQQHADAAVGQAADAFVQL